MAVALRQGQRKLKVLTGALLSINFVLTALIEQCKLKGRSAGVDRGQVEGIVGILEASGYLRPFQAEAVTAAVSSPFGRCIVTVPTGGGKTRISIAIAQAAGGRWLYLCPNTQLARQTAEQAPASLDYASYQSVTPRQLASCDGVICDECHRIAASSWGRKFERHCRALYRIGLSATPLLRQDVRNATVLGLLGPVVYQIEIKKLQDLGYLANGKYTNVRV